MYTTPAAMNSVSLMSEWFSMCITLPYAASAPSSPSSTITDSPSVMKPIWAHRRAGERPLKVGGEQRQQCAEEHRNRGENHQCIAERGVALHQVRTQHNQPEHAGFCQDA